MESSKHTTRLDEFGDAIRVIVRGTGILEDYNIDFLRQSNEYHDMLISRSQHRTQIHFGCSSSAFSESCRLVGDPGYFIFDWTVVEKLLVHY